MGSTRIDTYMMVSTGARHYQGCGTKYVVHANNGAIYEICSDNQNHTIYRKSIDGGISWQNKWDINTATNTAIAVWYDRWSGLSSDKIHVVYTEATGQDTRYRSIDTASSDALSTETIAFDGASSATTGCCLSVCSSRGGYIYVATMLDNGVETQFSRSVDGGANWTARSNVFESSSDDQIILMPGYAADNQDMMAFYWDASASEISRKLYDDSANSWSETSISTGMTSVSTGSAGFPNFAAAPDLTNSQNVLIAWTNVDTTNADLMCWTVTESSITAKTDVITNSADDQGLCALTIDVDTGNWYAFYCGATDGSETFFTDVNIYLRVSEDSGTTWGPEIKLTTASYSLRSISSIPRTDTAHAATVQFFVSFANIQELFTTSRVNAPNSGYQIGI